MSSKATVEAPANIAFVKYWGIRDEVETLPYNPSISMTLRRCHTRTTVEHLGSGGGDEAWLRGEEGELRPAEGELARGIFRHLDRIRSRTGAAGAFRVATGNSFPSGAGLASSASGFAALTLAAVRALAVELSPSELSSLARLSGSGSAARSVLGGYVEWPAPGGQPGAAASLAPSEHWDLCDVIAVVASGTKPVSSREGHHRAPHSLFFARRQEQIPQRLRQVRRAIEERRIDLLGPVLEEEAIDLHLISMSSLPPIVYWNAGTLAVIAAIYRLRRRGTPVYATLDAGANVHLICPPEAEEEVATEVGALPVLRRLIRDGVGPGPRTLAEHLF